MDNIGPFILSSIIVFFTIFIIIMYIKSKAFKSYPFYFNIYFCLIITFDNIIRLFKANKTDTADHPSASCKAQAFILSFFDKLFLISITGYAIINYIIMINPKAYGNHTAKIYIILVIIGVVYSLALTILFYNEGISNSTLQDTYVCYVKTGNDLKLILDTVCTCSLLLIDLFCIIRIISSISKLMKSDEIEKDSNRKKKLKYHLVRFLFDFFLNIITFGYVIIIILKLITSKGILKDCIYIVLALINELFFTINGELLNEIMRTLTCNKVEKFKKKESEMDTKLSPDQDDEEGENED